jgi:hypothetical protein
MRNGICNTTECKFDHDIIAANIAASKIQCPFQIKGGNCVVAGCKYNHDSANALMVANARKQTTCNMTSKGLPCKDDLCAYNHNPPPHIFCDYDCPPGFCNHDIRVTPIKKGTIAPVNIECNSGMTCERLCKTGDCKFSHGGETEDQIRARLARFPGNCKNILGCSRFKGGRGDCKFSHDETADQVEARLTKLLNK